MRFNSDITYGVPPEPMTIACAKFFSEHALLHAYVTFIIDLVGHVDHARFVANEALLEYARSKEEKEKYIAYSKSYGSAARQYFMYNEVAHEMWLCRCVDNYLCYISDLLALIFTSKPETLRSNETVTTEELLRHSRIEDVIQALAEKKVNQLSYKGLPELFKHLQDKLGFQLFQNEEEMYYARNAVELRNLIVHNRGIVNNVFLHRVPDYSGVIGDRIRLSDENLISIVALISRSVSDIDVRASSKFGLPQSCQTKDELMEKYVCCDCKFKGKEYHDIKNN